MRFEAGKLSLNLYDKCEMCERYVGGKESPCILLEIMHQDIIHNKWDRDITIHGCPDMTAKDESKVE